MNTSSTELLFHEIFQICHEVEQSLPRLTTQHILPSDFSQYEREFQAYVKYSYSLFEKAPETETSKEVETQDESETTSGFQSEEDHLLYTIVKKCRHDWKKICSKMEKLTKKKQKIPSLKIWYRNIIQGTARKLLTKFSEEEDQLLISGVQIYGLDWHKISIHLPSRDHVSIKNRYYYLRKMGRLENAGELEGLEGGEFMEDYV